MEEPPRKIVVFRQFDTAIEANIVEAKLHAYGIPCFLTDENLSNLYQGLGYYRQEFRVRLHLFEDDIDAANEALLHNALPVEDTETICPHCRSKNVERDFSRDILRTLGHVSFGLLVGPLPQLRVYHCLDCDKEFN